MTCYRINNIDIQNEMQISFKFMLKQQLQLDKDNYIYRFFLINLIKKITNSNQSFAVIT